MPTWSDYAEYTNPNTSALNSNIFGIYKLAVLQQDKTIKVFYIGSGNIRERLLMHLSNNETNLCISNKISKYCCYFSFATVAGGDIERKKEEQKLIDEYKQKGLAECNKNDAI
jgi:hypothetical protein